MVIDVSVFDVVKGLPYYSFQYENLFQSNLVNNLNTLGFIVATTSGPTWAQVGQQLLFTSIIGKMRQFSLCKRKSKKCSIPFRRGVHSLDRTVWNFTSAVKVCFTQKMLVKWSNCRSSEPFFAPGEGGKFKMMNGTNKC